MQKTRGVEKILDKWRGLIKSKKRAVISFEEIIQARIESLRHWIYPDSEPLDGWTFRQFRYDHTGNRTFLDDDWRPIKVGDTWGGPDMSAFFRCHARIHERFKGQQVVLKVYFSGDGLLRVNGDAYHGLDPFRDTVVMTNEARGDEEYDFEVESYIMWHFGEGTVKNFEVSGWAVFDQEMNDAYWDLKTAFNVMMTENLDQDVVDFLRKNLDEATRFIDQRSDDPAAVRETALRSQRMVRERIYESRKFQKEGLVHITGNSHLDLVYLWTHSEFVRKIGRTHATALRLMEQYPDYVFTQSQPHMYSQMKQHFPELYEQVKRRIKEGRWEAVGAFWVEPDCNLISGESMVRQLMHGIRFYEQEFGVTPRTAWIPDVFGTAWTMPQILVKSGLRYFVTHKMSVWNDTNPWKQNVFWWESPDGSRIFSHVPTTHFIGTAEPDHIKEHWDSFSERDEIGQSLYCYGWGDGGGGPDTEMLEYCKRYESFPGLVPCRNSTVEHALEGMRGNAVDADIPVINDELYLEEHRGVYTTKGRLKKLNRLCEHLYRKAELFSCFSLVPYPEEELDSGWREILTNQFHDSLPGTHVTRAYLDILESYDTAISIGHKALNDALGDIASRIDTTGPGQAVALFNALPSPRTSCVSVACDMTEAHVLDPNGNEIPCQFTTDFESNRPVLAFEAVDVPPVGYVVYRIVDGPGQLQSPDVSAERIDAHSILMENAHLKAIINESGEVVSLLDKGTGREVIDPENRANVFHLYEDIPGTFDAWDIEEHYTSHQFDLGTATVEIVEHGPVQSVLLVTRIFRQSKMIQRIVLRATARRLDFQTRIDWKEQHKLLKVRFHTNIRSRQATYDIAFGNITRPTTRNNSFETAKFEVPAHEWMDLSQTDRGLSVLTDSKYGYEAHDRMVSLSLLKGPTYPDPESDQEEHTFTYSLYPHAADWKAADTIGQAAELNDPVEAVIVDSHDGSLPSIHSLMTVDARGVTLEAVKQADDPDTRIVRLVERHGGQEMVTLSVDADVKSAAECDLLEHEHTPLPVRQDGSLSFSIDPYEIKTIKIKV
jgi:alpha-mannosidase